MIETEVFIQEVNLCRSLPKKTGIYFTQGIVISLYSAFVIILFLIYGIELFKKNQLSSQYQLLNQQMTILQTKVDELKIKYPINDLAQLNANVEQLRIQTSNKISAINALILNKNFSGYLLGLANVNTPGVWLIEINFNRSENQLSLTGYTLYHSALAQYLNQLAMQPAFHGLSFELSEVSEASSPARFIILSKRND